MLGYVMPEGFLTGIFTKNYIKTKRQLHGVIMTRLGLQKGRTIPCFSNDRATSYYRQEHRRCSALESVLHTGCEGVGEMHSTRYKAPCTLEGLIVGTFGNR
jgi:hypothetical protein